jgi:uncharacterized protein involved in exopolysaccharide biosynthesis
MNDLTLQRRLQPDGADGPAPESTLALVEYWRAISRRRWSILALTALVAILATLVASNIRPQYRATATLLFEQGKNKTVSIEEVYSQGLLQREYYQTQVEILKSEELARKTVVKLKLVTHPDYDPRQAQPSWWSRVIGSQAPRRPGRADRRRGPEERGAEVPQQPAGAAGAQQPARPDQLRVPRPGACREGAQYARRDLHRERPRRAHGDDAEGLGVAARAEWASCAARVDSAERALQDYRDRERIIDAKGLALSGASRQLEELTRSVVESRQKRAEAEAAYSMVQQAKAGARSELDSLPAVLRHPTCSG